MFQITIADVAFQFDKIFDNNEVSSFCIRELEKPHSDGPRKIGLDFKSGFDAMWVQQTLNNRKIKLNPYEVCLLKAKIISNPIGHVDGADSMEIVSSSSTKRHMGMDMLLPYSAMDDIHHKKAKLNVS